MAENKLPHHKNSRAAVGEMEPIFNAYFDVSLNPPDVIKGLVDWDLVMESLLEISGFDPNKYPEGKVEQMFKGAKRKYIGGAVPDQTQEITLKFEANLDTTNSIYVYKALRAWSDLAYNPLTGKFGIKKDYSGGPLIITQYNANGDIFRIIKWAKVYPLTSPKGPNTPGWDKSDNYKIEDFKLGADDFDETWV